MTAIGATGATGAPWLLASGRPAAGLAVEVRRTYERYVAFHADYREEEAGTLALWTLHTWTFDAADATPYILVTAPTSAAGKSRIFDVARCLVRSPFAVVDPTPASLFHAINRLHPTLLVDEADMLRENKALRAVLNAGYQPGTPVVRASGTYDVYCPKIFTGITHERPPLTDATLSRCIQLPMRRRLLSEPAAPFHRRTAMAETAELREVLRDDWAPGAVGTDDAPGPLMTADPKMPGGLTDRQEDMWAPLFAIADLLGGNWPDASREWAVILATAIETDPDTSVQVLRDCKAVIDNYKGDRIWTRDLAALRDALEEREFTDSLPPIRLAKRLVGFGIHPDSSPFRKQGSSVAQRGFTIRRGGRYAPAWRDAFQRYDI